MKTKITLILSLIVVFNFYSQDIIISGVGNNFQSSQSLIELYVKNDINTGQFYVKSIRDDLSVIGTFYLYPPLSAGTKIYITSDDYYWPGFFGIPYTYGAEGVCFFQGDDAIVIEDQFNTVIDIYGELGVDGTGTAWEFSRGWAYRLDGYGPNPTFTLSEWDIHDDAFIYCSGTNASCTDPYPIGSYTLSTNSKEMSAFRIQPNPTNKGYVNIMSKDYSLIEVQMFDVFGKQLIETKIDDSRLNVSNFKTGIYFLKISDGNSSSTKKLVIN